MSDHENWNNSQPDGLGSGTRSSQETLCNADNLGRLSKIFFTHLYFLKNFSNFLNVSGCDGSSQLKDSDNPMQQCQENIISNLSVSDTEGGMPDSMPSNLTLPGLNSAILMSGGIGSLEQTPIDIDEDTCYNPKMFYDSSSMVASHISSPMHGDVSSSYEAMESDDTGMESESLQLGSRNRRVFPCDWHPIQSTTTPGGSSDDDPYSPTSSRKKRRKTKRFSDYPKQGYNFTSPLSSQIPSPSPSGEAGTNETEDSSAPFSLAHRRSINSLPYNPNFNNSDSNLHTVMNNNARRHSNASESSQNTSMSRYIALKILVVNSQVCFTVKHHPLLSNFKRCTCDW